MARVDEAHPTVMSCLDISKQKLGFGVSFSCLFIEASKSGLSIPGSDDEEGAHWIARIVL